MAAKEDKLQELLDREMIRELKHRYCFAVDRGTPEDVMALFDEDCSLELVPGGRENGRGAVRAWYDNYIKNMRMTLSRHLIHNQVIEIEGDRARSRCYFDTAGEVKGVARVSAGFYEDTIVRKGGQWKFREVIIRMDWRVPLKEGWGGEKFIL